MLTRHVCREKKDCITDLIAFWNCFSLFHCNTTCDCSVIGTLWSAFSVIGLSHVMLQFVLLIPLVETIKEFVSFILKGVDLIDHTSIFLLRTINHLRNYYNVYTLRTLRK